MAILVARKFDVTLPADPADPERDNLGISGLKYVRNAPSVDFDTRAPQASAQNGVLARGKLGRVTPCGQCPAKN
eukprot:2588422-Alexandrium_andersonii.AAC.1